MKNQQEKRNQFVFTLGEDIEPKHQDIARASDSAEVNTTEAVPAWERSLEKLRQNKKRNESTSGTHQYPDGDGLILRKSKNYCSIVGEKVNINAAEPSHKVSPSVRSRTGTGSQHSVDVLLDPIQRERVYRTYLQRWQQQNTIESQQQESALNDTALLIQEDWLAAQNCLQSAADEDSPVTCTIRLQGNQSDVFAEKSFANDGADCAVEVNDEQNGQPIVHVHMHVIEPRGVANRGVSCISEQELLQQLSDKLRPHLADVLSGMVRVAVQKHTANLVRTLQSELLAEVPSAVDDVLKYNLAQVMNNIKRNLR